VLKEGSLSFADLLGRIAGRVEGAIAAIILGIDGIPIDRYAPSPEYDLDIEMVGTEFTTLLRRAMHTAEDTALGELNEMVLGTERATFLLRPITSDYFLMLALLPGGNIGRARFELRKAQLALQEEFSV
jgi:predicted regulator of Ras-like GTPase activity (Roadblock/LC7/MglB family)